jgi:GTP-binding protein HflX
LNENAAQAQKALLVGVALPSIPRSEAEDSLDELERLAETATLEVIDRAMQARRSVDRTFYVGKGKAEELKLQSESTGADLIIFDNDLSPAQMRNLEELTDMRILDRSGLILDIFALHARTHTAQVQVELAQLNYLLPRLTRMWTHLSRQAGGGAIRGMGAAGVRGPGETQLEIDRRIIRSRITHLRSRLDRIGRQLATSRKGRADLYKVALVGYTNAGKSTLMRALSGADVLVEDQLFATLDSTSRVVELEGPRKILLTDTVGFISRLPHHLFASFRATLEEAEEADLLLHVVDSSQKNYQSQMTTVEGVLSELGIGEKPVVVVYNKIDRLDGDPVVAHGDESSVAVSAVTGEGLANLQRAVVELSAGDSVTLELEIPMADGKLLAQLREHGEIIEEEYRATDVRLHVRLDRAWAERRQLEKFVAG